jgi:hypothetical protein
LNIFFNAEHSYNTDLSIKEEGLYMDENKYRDALSSKESLQNSVYMNDFIKDILKDHFVVDGLAPDTNIHNKFSRFAYMDPYNALSGCKEYLFFTKPRLNLFGNETKLASSADDEYSIDSWDLANNTYLRECFIQRPNVMKQWCGEFGNVKFMTSLTNMVRSSLELPGVESENSETGANIYGAKVTYKGTSWKSDQQFDFSLEFQDNKYLDIYHMFKIYDEYERLKNIGQVVPKAIFRANRIIHDQFTVFKMIVGPDGRELIYYAAAYGVLANGYPREVFSNITDLGGDGLRYNIPFKAHYVRDMDPIILEHFNQVSKQGFTGDIIEMEYNRNVGTEFSPVYDGSINSDWAIRPYIVAEHTNITQSSSKVPKKYKLIWLES